MFDKDGQFRRPLLFQIVQTRNPILGHKQERTSRKYQTNYIKTTELAKG